MRRPLLPSVLVAAAIGVVYLAVAPASADLAAAVFRSHLFAEHGFVVVNTAWYGGHNVPAYSMVMPPLGALVGPRVAAALACVAAAALFSLLVERAYGRRAAMIGGLWFAAGVSVQLLTGRIPFLLGVPFALGALLAAQRGRVRLAVGLAVVTPLASPVAGAFLALAGAAWAIGSRRRLGVWIAAAALVPVAVMTAIFPEGGTEPFVASAFWPALAALVAVAFALPRGQGVLRAGAIIYAGAVIACFAIPTAVGGNVTRLAALTLGPIAACILWPQRRWLLAAIAVPLLYWQLMPPIRDVVVVAGDPSTQASYYTPLIERLEKERGQLRVEVPFTRAHWEAAHLASHVPLARGWERQLDRELNGLFYSDKPLTSARYTEWLHENAVTFVALPDVGLDGSARQEAALIRAGLPVLHQVWSNANWKLYRVGGVDRSRARDTDADSFEVRATAPGSTVVRVRFSPHWAVVSGAGCVSEGPGGFTRVRALTAGTIQVAARVDLARALFRRTGERCDEK
ncbi:hypothetical protein [Capillimicrobium parvum]|uniref:Uncharacterized protein n=1 Tax=Capillimicrobium parvum TaxID=2884022 RepID=A0A9E7BYX5_9ACTN|nr:hypothetical protein [Capillimicrobium parvum]UGS33959.1 hypothetical protein DSM104329_00326 [Capillimicrobium parvum]